MGDGVGVLFVTRVIKSMNTLCGQSLQFLSVEQLVGLPGFNLKILKNRILLKVQALCHCIRICRRTFIHRNNYCVVVVLI